jgi:hypothetical protein
MLRLRGKVHRRMRAASLLLLGTMLANATATAQGGIDGDPSVTGEWSAPVDVGLIGIHAVLLNTGKVLLFEFPHAVEEGSAAVLVDPSTGAIEDVTVPWLRDVHCSGNSLLPDGRVLVTGGTVYGSSGHDGVSDVAFFDPMSQSWTQGAPLEKPRWYPTNVETADGSTLVMTGQAFDADLLPQKTMETYDSLTGGTELPQSANNTSDLYARMVLLPSGKLFRAGPNREGRLFDPATDSWSSVSSMGFGRRYEGGVVLLPGLRRVLTAGGTDTTTWERDNLDPGTNSAELIDFGQPVPAWQAIQPMNRVRIHPNLVLLPDGTVLTVGGSEVGFHLQPVHESELFDPVTGTWTLMAAQVAPRTYHSVALLLPDGRILSAGGYADDPMNTTIEYYSPPYLSHGPRPTISSAPEKITYGRSFRIGSPTPDSITRVVLIPASAVTHASNFGQRYVQLPFTRGTTSLSARAPRTGGIAPPGYYMLFLVDGNGVPSVAEFVRLS